MHMIGHSAFHDQSRLAFVQDRSNVSREIGVQLRRKNILATFRAEDDVKVNRSVSLWHGTTPFQG